jgi:hypothetical protein
MTAAAAAAAPDHPSDHDLITSVLRPMAAAGHHHGFAGGFIHLADVYSVAPERLAERYAPAPGTTTGSGGGMIWYFACPARCRHRAATAAGAMGQGCWAAAASSSETGGVAAAARPIWGPDGRRVGHSRALSYSSCGARTAATPWAAAVTRHGWCMVELALDDEQDGAGNFVLCKLFRSPRSRNEASVPALVSSCKRKVAVDDEHPDAPPGVRQHQMQRSC